MIATNESDERGALKELEALLREVASGRMPNRAEATRYTNCRATLMASRGRLSLPGFLIQCLSLYRFRDFITLYDPDTVAREQFLTRSFASARTSLEPQAARPRERSASTASSRWMF